MGSLARARRRAPCAECRSTHPGWPRSGLPDTRHRIVDVGHLFQHKLYTYSSGSDRTRKAPEVESTITGAQVLSTKPIANDGLSSSPWPLTSARHQPQNLLEQTTSRPRRTRESPVHASVTSPLAGVTASRSTSGLTLTRILRPAVKMSAVCSSRAARKTAKLAGGCAKRSTSFFKETIWSRASRSVVARRSLLAAVVRASERASARRRSSIAMSCGCDETRSRSRSSSSLTHRWDMRIRGPRTESDRIGPA